MSGGRMTLDSSLGHCSGRSRKLKAREICSPFPPFSFLFIVWSAIYRWGVSKPLASVDEYLDFFLVILSVFFWRVSVGEYSSLVFFPFSCSLLFLFSLSYSPCSYSPSVIVSPPCNSSCVSFAFFRPPLSAVLSSLNWIQSAFPRIKLSEAESVKRWRLFHQRSLTSSHFFHLTFPSTCQLP